ncbi:MAG: hypothetical protein EBU32_02950, partial [Opitutaceae bacterium]|nr:hypothetical protein [Opitutaceae bacterium]
MSGEFVRREQIIFMKTFLRLGLITLCSFVVLNAADATTPEQKLAALGLKLPSVPAAIANYVPAVRSGNLVFLAGQIARGPDGKFLAGKVGRELSEAQGADVARTCALQLIAVLQAEVGDLARVKRIVKVTGFVNCTDEFTAHEARVCIAEGQMLADQRRPRTFSPDQYFKTQAEMVELFADIPQALANTYEIALRCNLSIELGKSRLPLFPVPEGKTLDDFLRERANEGLQTRLLQLFPDATERATHLAEYEARLEFEIKTIIQMGFPGYFLIVADFINWAKN